MALPYGSGVSDDDEIFSVKRSAHNAGLAAITQAAVIVRDLADAMGQERAELARTVREASEAGLAVGATTPILRAITRSQERLTKARAALLDCAATWRAADPDMTPVNPTARRDSERAFKVSAAFPERR